MASQAYVSPSQLHKQQGRGPSGNCCTSSGSGRWRQPSSLPNWDLSLHLQSACGPELSGHALHTNDRQLSAVFLTASAAGGWSCQMDGHFRTILPAQQSVPMAVCLFVCLPVCVLAGAYLSELFMNFVTG